MNGPLFVCAVLFVKGLREATDLINGDQQSGGKT